jgi:hypothetical protein
LDCTPQKGLHLSRDTVRGGHSSLLSIRPDADGFLVHVETKGGKTEGRQKQRYILLKRGAVYSLTAPLASSIINVELKSKRGELLPIPNWLATEPEPIDAPLPATSVTSSSSSSSSSSERKTVKAVRTNARSSVAAASAPPSMATQSVALPSTSYFAPAHTSSRPRAPESIPPPPLLEQSVSGEPFLYELDGSFVSGDEFALMSAPVEHKTPLMMHHQHHHQQQQQQSLVRAVHHVRPSSPFGGLNGASSDSDPTSEGEHDHSPTGGSPPSPPSELDAFTGGWRDEDLFSLSTSQSTLGAYDGLLEPTFNRTSSQGAAAVAAGGPWTDFVLPTSSDPSHWSMQHKTVTLPSLSSHSTPQQLPLSAAAAVQADDFVLQASTPPMLDRTPSPPSPQHHHTMMTGAQASMVAALPLGGELEASSPRSTVSSSSSHHHHHATTMVQGSKRKSAPVAANSKRARRSAFSLAPRSWDVNAKRAPFRAIITCADKIEGKVSISFAGHILDESSVDVVGAKSIIVDVPPPPPVSVAGTCVEVDVELSIDRVKRWQGTFVYKFGLAGVAATPVDEEDDEEDDREPDDDGRGDEDERRGGGSGRSGKRHKPSGPVRLYAAFESMSAFKGFFSCPQLQKGFQALLQKYIAGELGGHRTDSVDAARRLFMTAVAKSEFEPFVRQVMVDVTRFCIHTSRVTTVDTHGFTMLHYVAALGYADLSRQLTDHGADVNLSGVQCACTPVSLVQEWEELQRERAEEALTLKHDESNNDKLLRHDEDNNVLRHDDKMINKLLNDDNSLNNKLMNDHKLMNAPPPLPIPPSSPSTTNITTSSSTVSSPLVNGAPVVVPKTEDHAVLMNKLQYADETAGSVIMAGSQCRGSSVVHDHASYEDHKLMHDRPKSSMPMSNMAGSTTTNKSISLSSTLHNDDPAKRFYANDGVHLYNVPTVLHNETRTNDDIANTTSGGRAIAVHTSSNASVESSSVESISSGSSVASSFTGSVIHYDTNAKVSAASVVAGGVGIRRYDDGPVPVDEDDDTDVSSPELSSLSEVPLVLKKSWTDPHPSMRLMYGSGERFSLSSAHDKERLHNGHKVTLMNATVPSSLMMKHNHKAKSSVVTERSHAPSSTPLSNDVYERYFGTRVLSLEINTTNPVSSFTSMSEPTVPLVPLSPKSMAASATNTEWLAPLASRLDYDPSTRSSEWLTPLAAADLVRHSSGSPPPSSTPFGVADFFGIQHPKKNMKKDVEPSDISTSSMEAPPTPRGRQLMRRHGGHRRIQRHHNGHHGADDDSSSDENNHTKRKSWNKALPVMAMVAAAAAAAVVSPQALEAWSSGSATGGASGARGGITPTSTAMVLARRSLQSSSTTGDGGSMTNKGHDRDSPGMAKAHCLAMIESLTAQVDRDRAVQDAATTAALSRSSREKQRSAVSSDSFSSPASRVPMTKMIQPTPTPASTPLIQPIRATSKLSPSDGVVMAAKVLKSSFADVVPAVVTQSKDSSKNGIDLTDVYGTSSSLFSFSSKHQSSSTAALHDGSHMSPVFQSTLAYPSSQWSNKQGFVTAKGIFHHCHYHHHHPHPRRDVCCYRCYQASYHPHSHTVNNIHINGHCSNCDVCLIDIIAITMASVVPSEALAAIVVSDAIALPALQVIDNQKRPVIKIPYQLAVQQQSKYQSGMYQQQQQQQDVLSQQQQQQSDQYSGLSAADVVAAAAAAEAAHWTGLSSRPVVQPRLYTQQQQSSQQQQFQSYQSLQQQTTRIKQASKQQQQQSQQGVSSKLVAQSQVQPSSSHHQHHLYQSVDQDRQLSSSRRLLQRPSRLSIPAGRKDQSVALSTHPSVPSSSHHSRPSRARAPSSLSWTQQEGDQSSFLSNASHVQTHQSHQVQSTDSSQVKSFVRLPLSFPPTASPPVIRSVAVAPGQHGQHGLSQETYRSLSDYQSKQQLQQQQHHAVPSAGVIPLSQCSQQSLLSVLQSNQSSQPQHRSHHQPLSQAHHQYQHQHQRHQSSSKNQPLPYPVEEFLQRGMEQLQISDQSISATSLPKASNNTSLSTSKVSSSKVMPTPASSSTSLATAKATINGPPMVVAAAPAVATSVATNGAVILSASSVAPSGSPTVRSSAMDHSNVAKKKIVYEDGSDGDNEDEEDDDDDMPPLISNVVSVSSSSLLSLSPNGDDNKVVSGVSTSSNQSSSSTTNGIAASAAMPSLSTSTGTISPMLSSEYGRSLLLDTATDEHNNPNGVSNGVNGVTCDGMDINDGKCITKSNKKNINKDNTHTKHKNHNADTKPLSMLAAVATAATTKKDLRNHDILEVASVSSNKNDNHNVKNGNNHLSMSSMHRHLSPNIASTSLSASTFDFNGKVLSCNSDMILESDGNVGGDNDDVNDVPSLTSLEALDASSKHHLPPQHKQQPWQQQRHQEEFVLNQKNKEKKNKQNQLSSSNTNHINIDAVVQTEVNNDIVALVDEYGSGNDDRRNYTVITTISSSTPSSMVHESQLRRQHQLRKLDVSGSSRNLGTKKVTKSMGVSPTITSSIVPVTSSWHRDDSGVIGEQEHSSIHSNNDNDGNNRVNHSHHQADDKIDYDGLLVFLLMMNAIISLLMIAAMVHSRRVIER